MGAPLVAPPFDVALARPNNCDEVVKSTQAFLRRVTAAFGDGKRDVHGCALPADVAVDPRLELFRIPQTDLRVALRGQFGVRVKRGCRIVAGETLAFYAGFLFPRYMSDAAQAPGGLLWEDVPSEYGARFLAELLREPASSDARELLLEPAPVCVETEWREDEWRLNDAGRRLCAQHFQRQVEMYVAGVDPSQMVHGSPLHAVLMTKGSAVRAVAEQFAKAAGDPNLSLHECFKLDCLPFGAGNLACMINAPHIDPLCRESGVVAPSNVSVQLRLLHGFPFPMLHADADVEGGVELLYDYGLGFFKDTKASDDLIEEALTNVRSGHREKASAREIAALKLQLDVSNENNKLLKVKLECAAAAPGSASSAPQPAAEPAAGPSAPPQPAAASATALGPRLSEPRNNALEGLQAPGAPALDRDGAPAPADVAPSFAAGQPGTAMLASENHDLRDTPAALPEAPSAAVHDIGAAERVGASAGDAETSALQARVAQLVAEKAACEHARRAGTVRERQLAEALQLERQRRDAFVGDLEARIARLEAEKVQNESARQNGRARERELGRALQSAQQGRDEAVAARARAEEELGTAAADLRTERRRAEELAALVQWLRDDASAAEAERANAAEQHRGLDADNQRLASEVQAQSRALELLEGQLRAAEDARRNASAQTEREAARAADLEAQLHLAQQGRDEGIAASARASEELRTAAADLRVERARSEELAALVQWLRDEASAADAALANTAQQQRELEGQLRTVEDARRNASAQSERAVARAADLEAQLQAVMAEQAVRDAARDVEVHRLEAEAASTRKELRRRKRKRTEAATEAPLRRRPAPVERLRRGGPRGALDTPPRAMALHDRRAMPAERGSSQDAAPVAIEAQENSSRAEVPRPHGAAASAAGTDDSSLSEGSLADAERVAPTPARPPNCQAVPPPPRTPPPQPEIQRPARPAAATAAAASTPNGPSSALKTPPAQSAPKAVNRAASASDAAGPSAGCGAQQPSDGWAMLFAVRRLARNVAALDDAAGAAAIAADGPFLEQLRRDMLGGRVPNYLEVLRVLAMARDKLQFSHYERGGAFAGRVKHEVHLRALAARPEVGAVVRISRKNSAGDHVLWVVFAVDKQTSRTFTRTTHKVLKRYPYGPSLVAASAADFEAQGLGNKLSVSPFLSSATLGSARFNFFDLVDQLARRRFVAAVIVID